MPPDLRIVTPPSYEGLPEGTVLRRGERLTYQDRQVEVANSPCPRGCGADVPVLLPTGQEGAPLCMCCGPREEPRASTRPMQ